jgi:hypothetical protein
MIVANLLILLKIDTMTFTSKNNFQTVILRVNLLTPRNENFASHPKAYLKAIL